MKKINSATGRKHGRGAGTGVPVRASDELREPVVLARRLTTRLTFATSHQAYLWITDRGRSRLIKH